MSIAVPLDELADHLTSYPWGYLVTVRDDGRAQSLAVPTRVEGGTLVATVGRGTASNALARPVVTMLFPGTSGEEFSLIVDGDAQLNGDRLSVTPTWAVLHRPALDSAEATTVGPAIAARAHVTRPSSHTIEGLLHPKELVDAAAALRRPSVVPSEPGVYAWYFDEAPPRVPTDGCHRLDGSWLLYVGISPKKPSPGGTASRQNLRKRLNNHYSGNASGSTLRLTLGSLLRDELGIQLQDARGRLTFGTGEDRLSQWMAEHARVTWVIDPEPWILEDYLIATLSLPLNLQGNAHHDFHASLAAARREARSIARQHPSAD